jgi:site-specific DNA-methyltransferase (adenine-specific)
MRGMPDCSIDAVVTDPPYGLSFMGKRWDCDVPSVKIWAECLRVLKPGGHLLAFAGTRTQHRMAVRIEDAGFEIRDMIAWVYGSGFPKSLDVSKAIDKAAGAEREKVLVPTKPGNTRGDRGISYAGESFSGFTDISEPATDAARQWQGWGTALKPALEPITVARKPLDGTVAANVLAHGTGAINVDGCRVGGGDGRPLIESKSEASLHSFGNGLNGSRCAGFTTQGRWPANLIHDGSDEVVGLFPESVARPVKPERLKVSGSGEKRGMFGQGSVVQSGYYDTETSAARFFYCAKASKADRGDNNSHPTVKPTELMRYLCRLVTPPGGVVLDPFMGSGSTGKAAAIEGFNFIGIERQEEYFRIAEKRILELGLSL